MAWKKHNEGGKDRFILQDIGKVTTERRMSKQKKIAALMEGK